VVIDPGACDPRRQVLVDLGLGLRGEVAQRVSKDDPDSVMGKPCSMALIDLVMMWPFQFVDLALFCAKTSTSAAWQVLRVFTGFPSGAIRTLNPKLRLSG
jgi:hypothetical protein